LFTRTADENGGRERRQEDAALKKLHLKTIKRHSPKIQSRGKKKSQDDSSSFYGSHSSDDNAANA
jgi:hypothetical protein